MGRLRRIVEHAARTADLDGRTVLPLGIEDSPIGRVTVHPNIIAIARDVPGDEGERVEIPHHDRLGFLRIGGTPRVDGRRPGEVLAVVRVAGQQRINPGIVGRAVGMGVFPVPQIESDVPAPEDQVARLRPGQGLRLLPYLSLLLLLLLLIQVVMERCIWSKAEK